MAEHYRKVHTKLWADARFNALNDDGKLVWVLLLTAPSMTPIPGVIVASEATLADMLGWTVDRYRKGYQEVLGKGFEVASEGRLVWVKNALRYQAPESINNAKFWRHGWSEIPECQLKRDIWEAIKTTCLEWWEALSQGFPEPLAKGYAKPFETQDDSDSDSEDKDEQKKKRRGAQGKPAPAGFTQALDAFHGYYERTHGGEKPTWHFPQRASVSKLLEAHGLETFLRRLAFLENTPPAWPKGAWNIATFAKHFDDCVPQSSNQSGLHFAIAMGNGVTP